MILWAKGAGGSLLQAFCGPLCEKDHRTFAEILRQGQERLPTTWRMDFSLKRHCPKKKKKKVLAMHSAYIYILPLSILTTSPLHIWAINTQVRVQTVPYEPIPVKSRKPHNIHTHPLPLLPFPKPPKQIPPSLPKKITHPPSPSPPTPATPPPTPSPFAPPSVSPPPRLLLLRRFPAPRWRPRTRFSAPRTPPSPRLCRRPRRRNACRFLPRRFRTVRFWCVS